MRLLLAFGLLFLFAVPSPAADRRDLPRGGREGVRAPAPGDVTPEKVERWRRMPPDERERLKERYRRFQSLPPEQRERILERQERWRRLPEEDRRYLRQRREIYRNAWPEDRRVIEKFFRRWRELPPPRRDQLRARIREWRDLPAAERDERMLDWPFYNRLRPDEQRVLSNFLFSEPPVRSGPPPRERGEEVLPPRDFGGPPSGRPRD